MGKYLFFNFYQPSSHTYSRNHLPFLESSDEMEFNSQFVEHKSLHPKSENDECVIKLLILDYWRKESSFN